MTAIPLPLTMPDGSALPPKPVVPGRLRTNEDWLAAQPELYQEVRDRIVGGDTNVRALAHEFAPQRWNSKTNQKGITEDAMRRAISAMIVEDITREKYDEVVQNKLSILRGEMADKASEVGQRATIKELGAVAMTIKLASDTIAGMGGAPPPVIRHEHLHVHTTPDALEQRREQVRQKLAQKSASVVPVEVVEEMEKRMNASAMPTASDGRPLT